MRHQIKGDSIVYWSLEDVSDFTRGPLEAFAIICLKLVLPPRGVAIYSFVATELRHQLTGRQFGAQSRPRTGIALLARTAITATSIGSALEPVAGWLADVAIKCGHVIDEVR